jgi:hypothetical protein
MTKLHQRSRRKQANRYKITLFYPVIQLILLLLLPGAWAGTLTVPGDHPTIQSAIDAASNGDTILVSDGVYAESINYSGKTITIRSANGAAATKLQGNGNNAPVVTFSGGEGAEAMLDGFLIDNQYHNGSQSRGIYITNNASPTIKNSILQGNVTATSVDGSAIYINGGGITLQDSTVGGDPDNRNTGRYGCGIYATNSSGHIAITGSHFTYNSAVRGGALYLVNISTTTTITNTTIENNTTTQQAAAIYSSNSPLGITNCTIDKNSVSNSASDGGALYLTGSDAATTITQSTLNDNSGRLGGAIYFNSSSGVLSVSDSEIRRNSALRGGGIYLYNIS